MRRRGFTVLELTLVMTIAGVVLTLVAPRFAALRDGSSVRAAVGDLGATFSTARQTAIARRSTVAIVLDTARGSVELRSAGKAILSRDLGGLYGVIVRANRDSAVYDPRGLGYGVSNLTITVRRGAVVDTLTMSRLGRVRW